MNPRSLIPPSARWCLAACAAFLLNGGLPGAEPAPAPSPESPPEYIVFLGADVVGNHEGQPYRIVGANRGSLEIKSATTTAVVPARQVDALRTMRGTRLGTLKATIARVRADSMRTTLNREMAEVQLAASANIRQQELSVAQAQADLQIGQMALGGARAEARQQQGAAIAERSNQIENQRNVMDDLVEDGPEQLEREAEARRADAEAAGGPRAPDPQLPFEYQDDPFADGFRLKCEISAAEPLEKAYLAVTILYVDPRGPGRKRQQTLIHPLGRVAQKPSRVTVTFPTLPLSFDLLGCHVHLYGNGQEVATNLSDRQQAMTEAQVYQHFLDNYLALNAGKTRPPAPFLLTPAARLRQKLDPALLEQVNYIRVSREGGATSVSTDEAGTQDVPPPIRTVLRFVRFFPALENGEPVEGRAKFKLSGLLH